VVTGAARGTRTGEERAELGGVRGRSGKNAGHSRERCDEVGEGEHCRQMSFDLRQKTTTFIYPGTATFIL